MDKPAPTPPAAWASAAEAGRAALASNQRPLPLKRVIAMLQEREAHLLAEEPEASGTAAQV